MNALEQSPDVEIFRELLAMERGAFETYTEALECYGDPLQAILLSIRSAHDSNLDFLADHLGALSEPVGAIKDRFSSAVEGTSIVFGEGAALMALEAGESQLAAAYDSAIQDGRLSRELRDELKNRLLPRIRANLVELETVRFS